MSSTTYGLGILVHTYVNIVSGNYKKKEYLNVPRTLQFFDLKSISTLNNANFK